MTEELQTASPSTGIVRGWSWRPGEACRSLTSWSDVASAWQQEGCRIWVDVEEPARADIEALDQVIDLDNNALEDCLDGPARPRIDEYDDYLALFFYGVLAVEESGSYAPHKLVAFCGQRFLVTVHPEEMRSIRSLHARCAKHGGKMLEAGVDVLLYRLMDHLADNYLALMDRFEQQVDALEEASFTKEGNEHLLRDVARVRTELLQVKRLASAMRTLLSPLFRGEFDYISGNLAMEFRHVEEHLTHALDLLEVLRERLTGVLHNYHSTLTMHTNDIVRVLTVFAAIMLPLSLIAGIYGMNLPTWPPADDPRSFWIILAAMVALAGGLLLYFRTRRWF